MIFVTFKGLVLLTTLVARFSLSRTDFSCFYAGSVKSIEIHNWFGFSISKFFPLLNYESKYISGENEITKGVELSREGSVTQLDTP